MTDLEDRLRQVLGQAASQLDVQPSTWPGPGAQAVRPRLRPGSLVAVAGVALAVAVAVVAIVVGNADKAGGGAAASGPPAHGLTTLAFPPPRLRGDGIGRVRFGQRLADVKPALTKLLGRPVRTGSSQGMCGLDGQDLEWPRLGAKSPRFGLLAAYFRHGRFVGYSYSNGGKRKSATRGPAPLATTRGLKLGDTMTRGRRLYGKAFHTSTAQGGSWSAKTSDGTLIGYAEGRAPAGTDVGPLSRIASIEAGHVGCPAMTP